MFLVRRRHHGAMDIVVHVVAVDFESTRDDAAALPPQCRGLKKSPSIRANSV